jgi:adenylylsulfate kinase-like enzyme
MTKNKVVWLTGLSGAGKTTIAAQMCQILHEQNIQPVWLDGDQVREAINDDLCGHDIQSRLKNAYRISKLARLFHDQGHMVIVSTMSLFHEIHKWNRQNINGYYEVLLEVNLETVVTRNPKGIYNTDKLASQAANIPGIDIKPQFPKEPDLLLDNNHPKANITKIAHMIIDRAVRNQ